jgi:hypothetical protein
MIPEIAIQIQCVRSVSVNQLREKSKTIKVIVQANVPIVTAFTPFASIGFKIGNPKNQIFFK